MPASTPCVENTDIYGVLTRPRLRPMAPITPLFSWNASAGDLPRPMIGTFKFDLRKPNADARFKRGKPICLELRLLPIVRFG